MTPRRALATLRVAAAARVRATSPATSLGLRLPGDLDVFDDDAPTCPRFLVIEPTERAADGNEAAAPMPPPPETSVAIDPDRRVYEQSIRLRERLGEVRPSLARLRDELSRARVSRPRLEIALADVARTLARARRSVCAVGAELIDLEDEARELAERGSTLLVMDEGRTR